MHNNPLTNIDPTGHWCTSADGQYSHAGGCNDGVDGQERFEGPGYSPDPVHFGDHEIDKGVDQGKWYPEDTFHIDSDPTGISDAFIGCAYDSQCAGFVSGGIAQAPAIYNGAKSGLSKAWDWAKGLFGGKSTLEDASKAAFNAADNIADFTVSNKHLMSAGGRWNKFATDSVDEVNQIIKEALESSSAQFLPNNQANSFKIITDLGREIGTKGESMVRIIIGVDGKIWTAFPTK